jgi:hypothetical protein
VKVCTISNRHSFRYHVNTFPFMFESKGRHLVISSSYHTCISFILLTHCIQYSPWCISRYCCSYCFGKWNTCLEGGLPPFPSPHLTTSGYPYH